MAAIGRDFANVLKQFRLGAGLAADPVKIVDHQDRRRAQPLLEGARILHLHAISVG